MCRITWAQSRGGTHTSRAHPSPAAGRNLRPQHRQRKQAKNQAFQASGLRHLGIFLPLGDLLRVLQLPRVKLQPTPLSQTRTQAYRHNGRHVCLWLSCPTVASICTHRPRRTPETYRDEDGLIKQFRWRVKYIEEKSLLIQNGEGGDEYL